MEDRFSKSKYRVPSHSHNLASRKKTVRKGSLSGTLMNMDAASTYDPTTDNDASYRNAIFDSSLRQCIKTEYGFVEPPPGVLARVQRAVEQDALETASPAPRRTLMLQSFFLSLRNALSRQLAGKLLTSGIAVVLALGISLTATTLERVSNNLHSMGDSADKGSSTSISVSLPTEVPQPSLPSFISPGQTIADLQSGDYNTLYSGGGSSEVDQYDLHTPPKKPSDNYQTRKEAATLGR